MLLSKLLSCTAQVLALLPNSRLPLLNPIAEAFKLVSAAFGELQKLHERSRGDSMATQAAAQPRGTEAVRSRWGAFTTGATAVQRAWAPSAPQQPACPPAEQAAAAAPAPAGGSSKPRWGRPSNEIGQLLKPNSAPQAARPAAHSQALHGEAMMHPDMHENSEPAVTTSSPGNDFHLSELPERHRLSEPGVAPSAFYPHGSGGSSRPEQQAQRPAGSLYSMFAGRRSSGGGGSSYRAAVPAERPLSQPESQQEVPVSGSQNQAADASSRWGRQPSALAGLLRNPAPLQPTGPAITARGADQLQQAVDGKQGSKRARRQQRQSRIVESSDSEDGMTLKDDGRSSGVLRRRFMLWRVGIVSMKAALEWTGSVGRLHASIQAFLKGPEDF